MSDAAEKSSNLRAELTAGLGVREALGNLARTVKQSCENRCEWDGESADKRLILLKHLPGASKGRRGQGLC